MVSEDGKPMIPAGKYNVSVGGGQPNTGASTVSGTLEVKGTLDLPE
jgi:beta-glucosidase